MRLVYVALLGLAQAAAPPLAMDVTADPAAQKITVTTPCCLPAGTLLEIELAEAISSHDRKRGDKFAFKVRTPLMHGEILAVPAGTAGVGEIVHADRARSGGKPGELVLAARYLVLDGTQVPVRGLKLGATGEDRSNSALAASFALGPFGLFVHGGEIQIPAGTIGKVKLAQELAIPHPTPQDTLTQTAQE